VSRALAGHEQIALKTRERVAQAARQAGYVPNTAARTLVSAAAASSAWCCRSEAEPGRSFLGEFVTGLGEGLVSHGADLILATAALGHSDCRCCATSSNPSRRRRRRHPHRRGRRAARLSAPARLSLRRPRPAARQRLCYNWLDTDGAHASRGFDMLYDLGHRHFGLVTISEPMTFRHLRQDGLAAAIGRRGDPSVRLDVATAPRFDRGARIQAINRMLQGPDRPTAVIALFDDWR